MPDLVLGAIQFKEGASLRRCKLDNLEETLREP